MQSRINKINGILSNGIFLYGAGANGSWCLDYLKRENIKVLGFIDSNPMIQNTEIGGLKVYSYQEYCGKYPENAILITAKHCAGEIFRMYKDDNPYIVSFDTWFENKYSADFDAIEFNDKCSHEILNTIRECMRSGDNSKIADIADPNAYFGVPFFYANNTGNSVFVDLGACTGDSIEKYLFAELGAVKKIYAFEPGKKQLKALKIRAERLINEWALDHDTIEIVEACVGAENIDVFFDNNAGVLRTKIDEKGIDKVSQITLDSYFKDEDVTFIKTDIEGNDYDAILGAEKLIKRCKPKLAISVYHKPDDVLRIYKLLNGWELGYKFALRQHSARLMETTLYCW